MLRWDKEERLEQRFTATVTAVTVVGHDRRLDRVGFSSYRTALCGWTTPAGHLILYDVHRTPFALLANFARQQSQVPRTIKKNISMFCENFFSLTTRLRRQMFLRRRTLEKSRNLVLNSELKSIKSARFRKINWRPVRSDRPTRRVHWQRGRKQKKMCTRTAKHSHLHRLLQRKHLHTCRTHNLQESRCQSRAGGRFFWLLTAAVLLRQARDNVLRCVSAVTVGFFCVFGQRKRERER